jgi:hypothetical protein
MPELRSPLPCLDCKADAAFDVRIALGQGMYERGQNLSPNGTPLQCCRIRQLGSGPPSGPTAPAPAKASGGFSMGFGFGRRALDKGTGIDADAEGYPIIRRQWLCGGEPMKEHK